MRKQGNYSRSRLPSPPSNLSKSHISSLQSQHLWGAMEEIELFSVDVEEVLRNQDRNLSGVKKAIHREKERAVKSLQHIKLQIMHNLDDLKISLQAQLDLLYKQYMERYAQLKGSVMDCKHTFDQVTQQFAYKNKTLPTQSYKQHSQMEYVEGRDQKLVKVANLSVLRSFQDNLTQIKRQHLFSHVSTLQKDTIRHINELSHQLLVFTQFNNDFFKKRQFDQVTSKFLIGFRSMLAQIYEQKPIYIRSMESIITKEEGPLLEPIQGKPLKEMAQPQSSKALKVGRSQQTASVDWAQDVKLTPMGTITIDSPEIVLCCVEVRSGVIAVGGRAGEIYICEGGKKVQVLRAHSASICTLALLYGEGRTYLAAGSDHGCSSISLWDTQNWKQRANIAQHRSAVTAIIDMDDGNTMLSGSYDKKINVYGMGDGKLKYTLQTSKAAVTGLVLNGDGSRMISCRLDNTLNVWQVARGPRRLVQGFKLERIIQNGITICSLACSSLRPQIAFIGTMDGKLKLINIQTGQAYRTIPCCPTAIIDIAVLQRSSNPEYPIVLCRPFKQNSLKVVNTKSAQVSSTPVSSSIEFGCGIGPKCFFLRGQRAVALLSQTQTSKDVRLFRLDLP